VPSSRQSGACSKTTRPHTPNMVTNGDLSDWLTWPADQLLRIGGVVAAWFFSEDATGFILVKMGFATLVLAAIVALFVFWQTVVEYCRSLWKT